MTWEGHLISTLALTYAVTKNIPFSIAISSFSHLPDLIEFNAGRLVFRKHRGVSHSPFLWICILLAMLPLTRHPMVTDSARLLASIGAEPYWILFPAIGAFMHLAEDALSFSGIPLWKGKKIALRFYKTGTITEVTTIIGLLAVALVLNFVCC